MATRRRNLFGFGKPKRKEVTLDEVRELQEEESESLCRHHDFDKAKRSLRQRPQAYARARGLRVEDQDRTAERDKMLKKLVGKGNTAAARAVAVGARKRSNPLTDNGPGDSEHYGTYERGKTGRATVSNVNGFGYQWEVSGVTANGEYFHRRFRSLADARAAAQRVAVGGYYEPERKRKGRNPFPPGKDFMREVIKRPGALHRKLGVPQDEDIPHALIEEAIEHPERFESTHDAQERLKREAVMARTMEGWHHRGRRNPEAETDRESSKLYDQFHGRGPNRIGVYDVPSGIPTSVAELGALLKIKIIGKGRMLQQLAWEPSEGVKLAADPGSDSLYIIGERQRLPANCLENLEDEFGDAARKDQFILGTIKEITYRTQKGFDKFETIDYYHELGEETGERPSLVYDRRSHRLLIVGGAYTVKPEGITN